MSLWKDFISYSFTSFFSSGKDRNQAAGKEVGEKGFISKTTTEIEKKYDTSVLCRSVGRVSNSVNSREDILEQEKRTYYMRQAISRRPSLSDAAVILKKNEGSVLLGRRGVLTDEQVSIIANSNEKVLDLTLFDLSDHQLELLSQFKGEEIIFGLKKLSDRQSEIFSKYNANTLNLSNVLRITDYQLDKLIQLRWEKLNLRDLVLSRIQKTKLNAYQGKIINRVYSQRKEMNQKIIEEQKELKKQREERRKIKSVAYTSFQYT